MDKEEDTEHTPSFEEFQKDLSKFLKDKWGSKGVAFSFPQPDIFRTQEEVPKENKSERLTKFELRPKEVKSYLDRFVIQQEEAKKVLSVAVCDHYHHVAACLGQTNCGGYTKQNVVLIGPTGVGKTYLVRCIADLMGVPFIKADATKFSETGYVGGDVEDLVRDLVHKANGDIELAQYGIIYLDEVDKIAAPPNIIGRDVSGQGVQRGLLKLMEETEVPIKSATDLTSQIQSVMEFQAKGKIERKTINTRHILFIMSGAFGGLTEIVSKRLLMRSIGFSQNLTLEKEDSDLQRKAQTHDFVRFGFDPEFVARLPVRVVLDDLSEDDLYRILKNSQDSIIKQYISDFKAYDIESIFSDDALRTIAQKAALEKTGARGMFTVCERILREFKYELPSSGIKRFVITPALVEAPQSELLRMLKDPDYTAHEFILLQIQSFERSFQSKHAISIHIDEGAQEWIANVYRQGKNSIEEILRESLKNYEYGLGLIYQNSGKNEFFMTSDVLEKPKETLDQWIRESYGVNKKRASTKLE